MPSRHSVGAIRPLSPSQGKESPHLGRRPLGGEALFTGRFIPQRDLRLFRAAFFLPRSVPDPAAVGHSGRDSQLGEHPSIKDNPRENEDDEEPEVSHDPS
jgi:hypothetical protein